MKLRHLYLLMTLPGALLPWLFLGPFFGEHGVDVPLFLRSIFTVNGAAAAASADLFFSGAVFIVLLYNEGRRLGMRQLWAYIPLGFLLGLSFSMPLFLYNRERAREARGE